MLKAGEKAPGWEYQREMLKAGEKALSKELVWVEQWEQVTVFDLVVEKVLELAKNWKL